MSGQTVTVNGMQFRFRDKPVAVICVDGGDPTYFADGFARGLLPNIRKLMASGFHGTAKSALPSFTNPNNVSIATGCPPSVHGISGNYFIDEKTGDAVPMTAMGARNVIIVTQVGANTDGDGLLSGIKMYKPGNFPRREELVNVVLELSDQQHALIDP